MAFSKAAYAYINLTTDTQVDDQTRLTSVFRLS